MVRFDQPDYEVAESDLYVEVCAVTDTSLIQKDITAILRTGNGLAIGRNSNLSTLPYVKHKHCV